MAEKTLRIQSADLASIVYNAADGLFAEDDCYGTGVLSSFSMSSEGATSMITINAYSKNFSERQINNVQVGVMYKLPLEKEKVDLATALLFEKYGGDKHFSAKINWLLVSASANPIFTNHAIEIKLPNPFMDILKTSKEIRNELDEFKAFAPNMLQEMGIPFTFNQRDSRFIGKKSLGHRRLQTYGTRCQEVAAMYNSEFLATASDDKNRALISLPKIKDNQYEDAYFQIKKERKLSSRGVPDNEVNEIGDFFKDALNVDLKDKTWKSSCYSIHTSMKEEGAAQ